MNDWVEYSGKTVDDALTNALIAMQTTSDQLEYEILEKKTKGLLGMFAKPAKIRVRLKKTIEGAAEVFLRDLFHAMNMDATFEITYNEEESELDIEIKGEEMGILIGKRGQTLDSLQYLTSLVVNKESEAYLKVKVDTENYRQRRKETLENLARNIASKVKRTRRPVTLEPMNSFERRIIHSALQGDKYVDTHSEGDEPFRKIVVTLKKSYREYDSRERDGRESRGFRNNSRGSYHKKPYRKDYNRQDYRRDYKSEYGHRSNFAGAAENSGQENNEVGIQAEDNQ